MHVVYDIHRAAAYLHHAVRWLHDFCDKFNAVNSLPLMSFQCLLRFANLIHPHMHPSMGRNNSELAHVLAKISLFIRVGIGDGFYIMPWNLFSCTSPLSMVMVNVIVAICFDVGGAI